MAGNLGLYWGMLPAAAAMLREVWRWAAPNERRLKASVTRARDLLALIEAAPEGVDTSPLKASFEAHIEDIAEESDRLSNTRFSVSTFVTMIVVAGLGGGIFWMLWGFGSYLTSVHHPWLGIAVQGVAWVVLALAVLLCLVGAGPQLYQDRRADNAAESALEAETQRGELPPGE